jgi:hypothetical protein
MLRSDSKLGDSANYRPIGLCMGSVPRPSPDSCFGRLAFLLLPQLNRCFAEAHFSLLAITARLLLCLGDIPTQYIMKRLRPHYIVLPLQPPTFLA